MNSRQLIIDRVNGLRDAGKISSAVAKIIRYMAYCDGVAIPQQEVMEWYGDLANSIGPRFRDLEDCGIIECVGRKVSKETGRPRKMYRLTGKLPDGPVGKTKDTRTVSCPRCGCEFRPRKTKGVL
jgi:hypothetical protein